jgi:hypothetical protein
VKPIGQSRLGPPALESQVLVLSPEQSPSRFRRATRATRDTALIAPTR